MNITIKCDNKKILEWIKNNTIIQSDILIIWEDIICKGYFDFCFVSE